MLVSCLAVSCSYVAVWQFVGSLLLGLAQKRSIKAEHYIRGDFYFISPDSYSWSFLLLLYVISFLFLRTIQAHVTQWHRQSQMACLISTTLRQLRINCDMLNIIQEQLLKYGSTSPSYQLVPPPPPPSLYISHLFTKWHEQSTLMSKKSCESPSLEMPD